MKILIAEDDDVSRLLLREFLESPPGCHTVIEATNGAEAWSAILAQGDLDLCILDVMMPELSGLDLLTRIRQNSSRAHLPVVLCTALNDRVTVTRALSLKVTQYIVKPFTRAKVLDRVVKAMQQPLAELVAEPSRSVCERLQIEPDVYQILLQSVISGLGDWLTEARQIDRWPSVAAAGLKANALKGACLNLGLSALATQLAQVESICGDQFALAEDARATSGIVNESAGGDVAAAVSRVEGELNRLKSFLESRLDSAS